MLRKAVPGQGRASIRAAPRRAARVCTGEARAIKDDIQRSRAELLAEKQYQCDLCRIERANRERRNEARA